MGHVRKNLSAGFWTFASYRAWFIKQNLVTVFYLIDFALYEAKVQDPALRFFSHGPYCCLCMSGTGRIEISLDVAPFNKSELSIVCYRVAKTSDDKNVKAKF